MREMSKGTMMAANGGGYKCNFCGYVNPTKAQAKYHYNHYKKGANWNGCNVSTTLWWWAAFQRVDHPVMNCSFKKSYTKV